MSDWIGGLLGLALAGFPMLSLRAIPLLARQRCRSGLLSLTAGVGCFGAGIGALVAIAFHSSSAKHADPTLQARHLSATFIELAYDATWTALLGVPVGVVLAVRVWRR